MVKHLYFQEKKSDSLISRIGIITIITFMFILSIYVSYGIGYHFGNIDGLKKAYRYEMFQKYPEYFQDWQFYGAEINEEGEGKRGMK